MPRPRKIRRLFFQPNTTYFKPVGIPLKNLEEIILSFDELEAIRLIDGEEMGQIKAGKKMKISQSTLSRLLKIGRKKLAEAIVNGKAIRIQGGDFKVMNSNDLKKRRMKNFIETETFCVCPKCNYKIEHKRGVPCAKIKCPDCNVLMKREI